MCVVGLQVPWGPWALRSLASCRMPRYWDRAGARPQGSVVCCLSYLTHRSLPRLNSPVSVINVTVLRSYNRARWGTVFVLRCLLHCYTYTVEVGDCIRAALLATLLYVQEVGDCIRATLLRIQLLGDWCTYATLLGDCTSATRIHVYTMMTPLHEREKDYYIMLPL